MEWCGDDWESLKSNQTLKKSKSCSSSSKVFDESHLAQSQRNLCLGNIVDHKNNSNKEKLLGKLRASCDANGKVTLKISRDELAELLGEIQNINNNNQQQPQQMTMMKKKKQLASAEQVLCRLIKKARDHEIANNHHHSHWKPVLETIPEC